MEGTGPRQVREGERLDVAEQNKRSRRAKSAAQANTRMRAQAKPMER